ncbi:hypothetical protein BMF94_5667 [Rhodotorula taiwanensis]|uniref:Uncharacterized protein n=1 Tax=Rhodotorula taiwanensis TaxID=741276 RepID=A0A2S5B3N6_9BASI|nr:hypothetical protein BMF94_5667 [Rhodotorula taiwanensis]
MILTVELPQELLLLLRQAPLRLSAMRSALLTANLEGVWWDLRTAALIDRAALTAETALQLGQMLQGARPDLFVAFEPTSEQAFVVNRRFLQARLEDERLVYVDVGGSAPDILSGPPSPVAALIRSLADHPAKEPLCTLDLGSTPDHSHLITLSGFLLDYAVAYVASGHAQRNCLGGRDLYLIEAFLITPKEQRNNLFSFSYPAELVSTHKDSPLFAPEDVVEAAKIQLAARFAKAQTKEAELSGFRLEVQHSTVSLDQVAL